MNSEERAVNLAPSLQKIIAEEGLNAKEVTLALETDDQKRSHIQNRHACLMSDGEKAGIWSVPSLRKLFRGSRTPPNMDDYPEDYTPFFFAIESEVLNFCDEYGDLTDQQLEEIYSSMRRRPDGKSLGPAHDLIWQVAAVLLGTHEVSEAEFDAIFGRLACSARTWAMRPVSRNYVAYLRENLT